MIYTFAEIRGNVEFWPNQLSELVPDYIICVECGSKEFLKTNFAYMYVPSWHLNEL